MRRRDFIASIATALAAPPGIAVAQQRRAIPIVGVLSPLSPQDKTWEEGVRQGLRDLGYVEGKTIAFEYRRADGRFDRLPVLANELVRLPVDVIVAIVTQASLAAKQATAT